MTNEQILFAALGMLAVVIMVVRALPVRARVLHALSWALPAFGGWLLALAVTPPARELIGLLVLLFAGTMVLSFDANLMWSRHVVRPRDPWVVRPASAGEFYIAQGLLDELLAMLRVEMQLMKDSQDRKSLRRLNDGLARLSELDPPNDEWRSILEDARAHITRVATLYETQPNGPEQATLKEIYDSWEQLLARIHRVRHDAVS